MYDLHQSGPPKRVGAIPVYRSIWARSVQGRLYIGDTDHGLLIFDLANPVEPVLINQIPSGKTSSDVAVAGELAVVSDYNGFLRRAAGL